MPQILAAHLSSERGRFVNAVVVGALHLGAIYTLLVAFDVVPNPVAPSPPIDFSIIDRQPPKVDPTAVVGTAPTFRHPALPQEPATPVIQTLDVSSEPANTGPETVTPPAANFPPVPGVSSPLRAVTSSHTVPPYPQLALRLGFQGSVRLRISVDEHGKIVGAVVETSSGHPDLDAAAISWVEKQWRYEPAMRDGHPVAATATAVVTFKLNQARF